LQLFIVYDLYEALQKPMGRNFHAPPTPNKILPIYTILESYEHRHKEKEIIIQFLLLLRSIFKKKKN